MLLCSGPLAGVAGIVKDRQVDHLYLHIVPLPARSYLLFLPITKKLLPQPHLVVNVLIGTSNIADEIGCLAGGFWPCARKLGLFYFPHVLFIVLFFLFFDKFQFVKVSLFDDFDVVVEVGALEVDLDEDEDENVDEKDDKEGNLSG